MKILVLGGDGFMGWPLSLYLSNSGHEITILDNLSRRNIDNELEAGSLTPIRPLGERLRVWRELTGQRIEFLRLDVAAQYDLLADYIFHTRPDVIIHLAEQRAAPYSMKTAGHKRYTVENNVRATHNILAALVHTGVDAHLVHIGTMGVYGYGTAGGTIPEGYLDVHMYKKFEDQFQKIYSNSPHIPPRPKSRF